MSWTEAMRVGDRGRVVLPAGIHERRAASLRGDDAGTSSTHPLSLGDRLCLALTARLGATAWAADMEWRGRPGASLIR